MSLYFASNKPRSLHRQPPTYTCNDSPIPPKLEHTLGQWLGKTNNTYSHFVSSDNTSHCLTPQLSHSSLLENDSQLSQPQLSSSPPPLLMSSSCSSPVILSSEQQQLTTCPCCQIPQCKAWKKMTTTVQKLETETCLAAEIGQSLLVKNESCRMESNQLKTKLKHYQERIHELETSLGDSESFARQMNWEKEKWKRQGERSEKNLNRSMKDLEIANTKTNVLAEELQQAQHKVEKLELLQVKSQQFDTHEEALKLEIEEIKNELAISRKNEINLTLENRILKRANDMLLWDYQDMFSKYSAKKFNSRYIKPASSSSSPAIGTNTSAVKAVKNEWVSMVKNLQIENNSLRHEIIDTTTRLDDSRNEMIALKDKANLASRNQYLDTMLTSYTKEAQSSRCGSMRHTDDSIIQQSVSTPTSSPLLERLSGTKPTSSITATLDEQHSTSITLLKQARDILHRLRSTDIRKLNRRLQRTFDIEQLTQMSDTILQNIMTDVDTMDARFFWLAPDENDDDDKNCSVTDDFCSLVHLVQELLQEIAQSSLTINQLQVAYVKKVEENDTRIRHDVLGKHHEQLDDTPLAASMLCTQPITGHDSTVMDSDTKPRTANDSARSPTKTAGHDESRTATENKRRSLTHASSHDKDNTFWSSTFASIMDEWYFMAMKNASSSLDREWLFWNCTHGMASRWTDND